jgi:phasin family protein
MSKPKSTAEDTARKATDGAQPTLQSGTEALKDNLDKALKNYDQMVAFGKQGATALSQSAGATAKGAESLHDEFYAYSKRSIESSLSAANALFGAKSLAEVVEVQTGFAKSAFEAYADELTKLSEIYLATARESYAPLKGRVQAWMDVVQQARTN